MEGIAEGDEESLGEINGISEGEEEDEDAFDRDDDDDDVAMLPLSFTGLTVNAPKPSTKDAISNSYGSSKDDDAMMFDMDADRTPALSPLHQHNLSPSQYSASSVSSSPFSYPQQPSYGKEGRQAARSVSSTSFMWRSSVKTGRKKRSPQSYPPPPILSRKSPCPGSGNEGLSVISFSDFNELEWQRFMLQFEILLNKGVKEGAWRQGVSSAGAIAMSCPKF